MTSWADNKKTFFRYEVLERLEAGLELLGHEVKAVKSGRLNLAAAYVVVRGGEAFLVGASIAPYQPANTPLGYEPDRARRLLLSREEIAKLATLDHRQKLTAIPLAVYSKGRRIKVEIGLARGKKAHDKRETTKKREADREMERTLKYTNG